MGIGLYSWQSHRHTYICAYINTHVHTHIRTYAHTHIHTHIHTYIHSYIHTYIHMYMIHSFMYVRIYMGIYICFSIIYIYALYIDVELSIAVSALLQKWGLLWQFVNDWLDWMLSPFSLYFCRVFGYFHFFQLVLPNIWMVRFKHRENVYKTTVSLYIYVCRIA